MSERQKADDVAIRSAHRLDSSKYQRTDDVVTEDTTTRVFADLMLPAKIITGLDHAGFIHPSPIQWAALPIATKVGLDLVVQSKSGTGKTLVYVVTALNMINTEINSVQALVVAPTREIAVQGTRVALDIAGASMPDLKVHTFIGGLAVAEDQLKLKRCHLAVGTPGRLKQLIEGNFLSTKSIRFFALDEADKLMDPSFKNDVTWIFNKLPSAKQVMALSATYPEDLAVMLTSFMKDPTHVRLSKDNQVLKGVSQFAIPLPYHPQPLEQDKIKYEALLSLLTSVTFSQCLVFTNYIVKAESICEKLNQHGWPATFIASSQDQATRLRVLQSLKHFQCRVLLTTDLTARGIDAHNVNFVVNMDVPWEAETYLHRIGRAGRFGTFGVAVSLASQGAELDLLRNIVYLTNSAISILPFASESTECLPDLGKLHQMKREGSDISELSLVEPLEALDIGPGVAQQAEVSSREEVAVKEIKKSKNKNLKKNKKDALKNPQSQLAVKENFDPNIIPFVEDIPTPQEYYDYDNAHTGDEDVSCYYDENEYFSPNGSDTGELKTEEEYQKLDNQFIINFYKEVTGFEYRFKEESSASEIDDVGKATETLRNFSLRSSAKPSANVNPECNMDAIKKEVEQFMNEPKEGVSIESSDAKEDLIDDTTVEAFRVLQRHLDSEWSRNLAEAQSKVDQAGNLARTVELLMSEEVPDVAPEDNLDVGAANGLSTSFKEEVDLNVFDDGDSKFETEDEELDLDLDIDEESDEVPDDPYPSPFRSEWQPVEDETSNAKNGNPLWQRGDSVDDVVDDHMLPGADAGAGHHRGEVYGSVGNYEFPFPDPDKVLAGFLGVPLSWKTTFPAWLDHVQRNKQVIEQIEYQKRISAKNTWGQFTKETSNL